MASIVSEYQRFLDCLTQQDVPDDVRRLAYLIFDHIQPLAEVGSTRRARSVRLAPLALRRLIDQPIAYEGNSDAPKAGSGLG